MTTEKKKRRVAYTTYDAPDGLEGVAVCVEGTSGFRPLPDYGPYADKSRAEGIAQRLNKRLGITEHEADMIVASTFGKRAGKVSRSRA